VPPDRRFGIARAARSRFGIAKRSETSDRSTDPGVGIAKRSETSDRFDRAHGQFGALSAVRPFLSAAAPAGPKRRHLPSAPRLGRRHARRLRRDTRTGPSPRHADNDLTTVVLAAVRFCRCGVVAARSLEPAHAPAHDAQELFARRRRARDHSPVVHEERVRFAHSSRVGRSAVSTRRTSTSSPSSAATLFARSNVSAGARHQPFRQAVTTTLPGTSSGRLCDASSQRGASASGAKGFQTSSRCRCGPPCDNRAS